MNAGKNETPHVEWNSQLEQSVKALAETGIAYKWMHLESARFFSNLNNILSYSAIVLGPIASALTSINISFDSNIIPILVIVITLGSGILVSAVKFGKFEEAGHSHKIAAAKYTSLVTNCRRQLSLYRKDRENAAEYLNWYNNSHEEIFSSSPLIIGRIQNQYLKYARENNKTIPDDGDIFVADGMLNELCNNNEIEVNNSESQNENEEEAKTPPNSLAIVINRPNQRQSIRNLHSYNPSAALNKFADGKMRYEMRRLYGFK